VATAVALLAMVRSSYGALPPRAGSSHLRCYIEPSLHGSPTILPAATRSGKKGPLLSGGLLGAPRDCAPTGIVIRTRVISIGRSADHHGLGVRRCETGVDQFDQQSDREAVRKQDRLGAAIGTAGEQFECAAALAARRRPRRR
jgi:hypothetical protein